MPENNFQDLRSEVDILISHGSAQSAATRLDELWRSDPSLACAAFIVARIDKLKAKLELTPFRVALLRSFTLEPVVPLLRAATFPYRLALQVHVGGYNCYMQEVLDPESSLYQFRPEVVILAVRTADIMPEVWQSYSSLAPDDVKNVTQRTCDLIESCIASFRNNSDGTLVVHTLEQSSDSAFGVLNSQSELSQQDAIQTVNRELRCIARRYPGIYVLDYDALVARHGRLFWQDERKLYSAGLPVAAHQLTNLANEWLRFIVPLSGRSVKALVVDLDNTLWGGVIGEDGMMGIKVGPDYPGAAYLSLQQTLLDLSRRGILLAICSKNNPDEALEALEKHPSMLLRPADFAAIRINWNDKARGLQEIAQELNIGTDALAFLDDNPFEREHIRRTLPQVRVIDLPDDPAQFARTLRNRPEFERLTLSTEDRQRTQLYVERRERARMEQNFQSKEDFYRYLRQEAEIAPLLPSTLTRISQLTQKTNQFNLTTRRYSEQQIAEIAAKPGWRISSIQVRDRFGDHGVVGVVITCDKDDRCEIDTFLLSCRVIGRSIETALLSYLVQSAASRGCKRLAGWFLPTKKNALVSNFYRDNGFECRAQDDNGSLWMFELEHQQIAPPNWINLVMSGGHN